MRAFLAAAAVFVALAVRLPEAWGQMIQVAPVSVTLAPGQQAATVSVSNQSTAPTVIQVRPFAWSATGDADQLAPTEALAVSPPFAQLAPGQTQTIRLVLRGERGAAEASYRLLIDEIPPPASSGGIRIALRLSIPVFAPPTQRGDVQLSGAVVLDGADATLVLRNRGNLHARVLQASIEPADGPAIPVRTASRPYLLPGAERSWHIPGPVRLRAGGSAKVVAVTDAGPVATLVPISRGR